MSTVPQISVIVPVYNAALHLLTCLQGICNQTFQDIEIICINDGSTDASPEILQYHAASDSRVRVIHQEKQGAGPARNAGLAAARGEYVIFLDADDLYEPQMLERMLARAEKHHADVVICRADALEENGLRRSMPNQLRMEHLRKCGKDAFCPRLELPQHLFQFVCGWPWDKLYRREFLLRSGLQFQALPHTEDAGFIYLSLVKAAVVSVEPATLVHHRLHGASISHNMQCSTACMTDALLDIHGALLREHASNEALFKSFRHWAMNMVVWFYRQLEGEAAVALQADVRRRLEPEIKLLEMGRSYYPRRKDWLHYKRCALEGYTFKEWKFLGIPVLLREWVNGKKI